MFHALITTYILSIHAYLGLSIVKRSDLLKMIFDCDDKGNIIINSYKADTLQRIQQAAGYTFEGCPTEAQSLHDRFRALLKSYLSNEVDTSNKGNPHLRHIYN